MSPSPPIVLTFAASDPTGGAGLQADLLTLASMGCHPLSVVTALTMQDTRGVEGILAVEADWVAGQAKHLLEDMRVAAFKLGVLGSLENIHSIADVIADYPEVPVILDPVLASGRGDALASDEMIGALRELIVPQCTVVTPNSLEARQLAASGDDEDEIELAECARRLLQLGCEYVLVTGTHEAGVEVVNTLYAGGAVVREDRWQRLPGSYHGSGCTLASAIAPALSNRLEVAEAGRDAQEYTLQALPRSFPPRMGQLLPDRVFLALGREDGDLRAARARLAGRILGASCYDRLELAQAAVAAGVDYVAFGSVFASPTKPGAVRAPHSLFTKARKLGVPLAAIGGITLENAPRLISAGADLLAVISDLFEAPDVSLRARQYGKLFT